MNPKELRKLETELIKEFSDRLRNASGKVVRMVQGVDETNNDLLDAYVLGKYVMAQTIVSQTLLLMADVNFYKQIQHPDNQKILSFLLDGDKTKRDIRAHLAPSKLTPEMLTGMVTAGILDFRTEWVKDRSPSPDNLVYFLTPAARSYLEDSKQLQDQR